MRGKSALTNNVFEQEFASMGVCWLRFSVGFFAVLCDRWAEKIRGTLEIVEIGRAA